MQKECLTNNFDLIRLFGALQVMLANHYIWHFDLGIKMPVFGAFSGVPIFFFLAGIFIPMSFERHPDIFQYMRNRVLKIVPVMWVSIFVALVLMISAGFIPNTTFCSFLKWLGIYLVYPLYTPEWLRGYGVGTINGALWIIPTQLTFYAIIPILYSGFKIGSRSSFWIVILFMSMLAGKIALFEILQYLNFDENSNIGKIVGSSFLVHFPMFLIGMFVYGNFDFFYKIVKGRFFIFLMFHLGLFFALKHFGIQASILASDQSFWKYPLMITLALCVLSAGYSMPKLSDFILKRKDVSYGLYVYHMPVANFVLYLFGGGWVSALIAALVTLIVSVLSYIFIESKFLRLKKCSLRDG